jgi:hypothetical protein
MKKLNKYDTLIANTYYYIGLIYLYDMQRDMISAE